MDLLEAIRARRSCRRYLPGPVPREALERVVEAATWAPSGKNRQNWRIFVVRGEARDRLAELSGRSFAFHEDSLRRLYEEKTVEFTRGFFRDFGGAPVVLVFFTEKTEDGPFVDLQAGAAAVENALLACVAEGLQGCWMTAPVRFAGEIAALLGAEGLDLVAVVPVGYPARKAPEPPRRPDRIVWVGFE
jgi:nitroreductase